jgi:hypothetical protein
LRAVAATLSPLFNTASVRLRPNPRELPVMNQTFVIVFLILFDTKVGYLHADNFVERLKLFC